MIAILAAVAIITPSDSHVARIHWFCKEHGSRVFVLLLWIVHHSITTTTAHFSDMIRIILPHTIDSVDRKMYLVDDNRWCCWWYGDNDRTIGNILNCCCEKDGVV